MKAKKITIWVVIGLLCVAATIVLVVHVMHLRPCSVTVRGAVIQSDADTRKEVPLSNVIITLSDGANRATTTSSTSGYFKVTLYKRVRPRETMYLDFRTFGYHPFHMKLKLGPHAHLKQLCIAKMKPIVAAAATVVYHKPVLISNVHIRYTVNYATETNVGAMAKSFQVDNQSNIPCNGHALCSPDGNWRASRGTAKLDAGVGNLLRNVRVSCIAGPCPFTRSQTDNLRHDHQSVVVSAIDWSDTATFLAEAEVFHKSIASDVRESYPVIYGNDLHFTLPPTAEGPSINADIDGTPIVFPLGKDLYMTWATCTYSSNLGSKEAPAYQCKLKQGYRF